MVVLRGITWNHPRGFQPLVETARSYEQETGIRVVWEKRSLKDFGDAPIAVLAQYYDVLVIDHPHVGVAARERILAPLDQILPDGLLAGLLDQGAGPSAGSYAYDGHQWALPLDAAHHVSAYRPDLFDDRLPGTWEEVLVLGQRLARAGTPMALPLAPTDSICSFLTLCASTGSPPGVDHALVQSEIGVASLRWLRRAADIAHSSSTQWNPIACLDYMARTDDVPYCPITFSYSNYAREGYEMHTLAFADVPGLRGALLGGAGFAVSAGAAGPEEAARYGAWLCSAQVQAGPYVASGGQPGNRVAWMDSDADRLTNGFFSSTYRSLDQAYVRPRHPGFVPFQEWAGREIHSFLGGTEAAEAVLGRLEEAYRASLENGNHGGGQDL